MKPAQRTEQGSDQLSMLLVIAEVHVDGVDEGAGHDCFGVQICPGALLSTNERRHSYSYWSLFVGMLGESA